MLGALIDPFRVRQGFNVITRVRQVADAVREDASFLVLARKALAPLPFDRWPVPSGSPFAARAITRVPSLKDRRIALMATGGSGALASLVGAAKAFEDAGCSPAIISVCSGSALFGYPIAAGMAADDVADLVLSLRPQDYLDPDWRGLGRSVTRRLQGFGGLLRGDALEATYRRALGDMTLGELPIPCYAPVWSIDENRLEYIGPRTRPDMQVAHAVHMAVALPLFVAPVSLDGMWWGDGGIVDIFPVRPVLDLEGGCDAAIAINGFYPPEFTGEDEHGWLERRWSILHAASQVRTCQQVELARENLVRLRRSLDVRLIEPVPFDVVRGAGFYRQFVDTADWPRFMLAGREQTGAAIASLAHSLRVAS